MKTLEELEEEMKLQQIKITDLDKKVDGLKMQLVDERAKNKALIKVLEKSLAQILGIMNN